MTRPDQSLHEVTTLLEEGRDTDAMTAIERLAEQTDDPVLRQELNAVVANGQTSARGFRRAWDRLQIAYVVGR
jgi:hypothetical protein